MDQMTLQAVCSACGARLYEDRQEVRALSRWRWNGESWEHKCADAPPQAGHFPSFRQQERQRTAVGDPHARG
jgi:hypothetical protein